MENGIGQNGGADDAPERREAEVVIWNAPASGPSTGSHSEEPVDLPSARRASSDSELNAEVGTTAALTSFSIPLNAFATERAYLTSYLCDL